jgi:hypothetical protein
MRGERTSLRVARDARQLGAQDADTLAHRDAAFQHEGADLIDDAGALRHQPLAHAMQRLQVELIGSLGRHELHRRALHCLGNRFGILEVVLLPLAIRADVSGRHQTGLRDQAMRVCRLR